MRPVDRGACPSDESGQEQAFSEYGHAKPHLLRRLGDYCSFCEIQLTTLAVEHIRHKDGNPDLECRWDNFLLACPSCNSTKGTKVDTAADVELYLWPHRDRTFEVFMYEADGVVRVRDQADSALHTRAIATANLVGLTKRPGHGLTAEQLKRASDRRYEKRREAWQEAVEARSDLRAESSAVVRGLIIKSARALGFFSVWMAVFADDDEMRAALRDAFPGTARDRVDPLPPTPEP